MQMKENKLLELSKQFAVEIINICKMIRMERDEKVLVNQLLRSGTSVGANIHEGNYASSRLDFINKFQIALKECYETEYWLELFLRTDYLQEREYDHLLAECQKLRKLLSVSITTAKENAGLI